MDSTIMAKKVQVKSKDSDEVLFECELSNEAEAYEYAGKMDEMGIDVYVISPNVIDTLSEALGLDKDEDDAFKHSVYEEVHDHEGAEESDSCCNTYVDAGDPTKLQ
jgi:hypothetical protein